jgi:hypothetical protein
MWHDGQRELKLAMRLLIGQRMHYVDIWCAEIILVNSHQISIKTQHLYKETYKITSISLCQISTALPVDSWTFQVALHLWFLRKSSQRFVRALQSSQTTNQTLKSNVTSSTLPVSSRSPRISLKWRKQSSKMMIWILKLSIRLIFAILPIKASHMALQWRFNVILKSFKQLPANLMDFDRNSDLYGGWCEWWSLRGQCAEYCFMDFSNQQLRFLSIEWCLIIPIILVISLTKWNANPTLRKVFTCIIFLATHCELKELFKTHPRCLRMMFPAPGLELCKRFFDWVEIWGVWRQISIFYAVFIAQTLYMLELAKNQQGLSTSSWWIFALSIISTERGPGYGFVWGMTCRSRNSINKSPLNDPCTIIQSTNPSYV